MAQQFDYPKTETQLREIQDALYQHSKEVYEAGGRPAFKGLLEIMSAESTIITAIHNIKGNHGSETPGVDSKTMRKDYLQKPFPWVVADIQRAFKYFEPQQIRRVYIDKPGKSEKRPLGIPAIRDRIVQECMRIVLEPILEAQFFAHSYGFRPMRDAAMALERVDIIMHNTGNYWIVEGDISKCFDRIDHSILIKRLYHMGIKDRRVLQIIKAMLKAGVMEECAVNEEGTPQGGLISPLLANVYLDIMDEWVSKQWENKRTRHQYVQDQSRYAVMRKKTTLVPGYLVRYADDFIIATDTRAHAEDWKARLQSFLQEKMKLTLSQEKTLITDIRKKYIKFLGYEFKMVRGKSRRGYIPRTIPDRERLKRRADKIAEDIKKIPGNYSREQMVGAINRINSQIRGIIQYYQCCTWVNIAMQKHSRKLQLAARRRLKQYNGKWIPANQTRNLPRVHQQYKQKIPSIKYRDIYVGFTALTFCRWERTPPKNQAETPYTDTGRQLYFERTKKKKMQARLDEMYSDRSARAISYGKWGKFNNFEFIMNRAYALNRDKLRCRVCGGWLIANTPWAHRINPYLPLDKVNRDIVYCVGYGAPNVWNWAPEAGGNQWRTTRDITDEWNVVTAIGTFQDVCADATAPGRNNDPDMLVVGKLGQGWGSKVHDSYLTADEQYSHISLWCLLSSPLLIGCDMANMDDFTLNLLTNNEVIAVSQDPMVAPAKKMMVENGQVWSKKLYDGSYAVGFFHVDPYFILWDQEDAEAMQMREYAFDFDLKQLGIEGKAMVRDLWRQKDLGEVNGIFRTEVPYHGVTFVKITPAK